VKKKISKKKTAGKKSAQTKSRVPSWIGKISDVARELHIGERYIFQLAKQGLPRVSPGRYNIVKTFRWYVRYLQRKLVERAHPDDENGKGAVAGAGAGETRHKLLSIEAELKQIELAEKREQLISIERVEKDLAKIVTEVRTRILALPPRLAAEVLGETDLAVSQVKIERSLKGALDVLSQFDPDDDVEDRGKARSSSRVS
jgi:phage terminase Nu1 subunit (DNA packaging protein)